MAGRVRVLHEVKKSYPNEWALCFQWCVYQYDDGSSERGYRYIWRDPTGRQMAHRGQARIPNINTMEELIKKAKAAGWGND